MTLKECYTTFGVDYDDLLHRLQSEALIEKFMLKFLKDPSYPALVEHLSAGDLDEAFRACHTLKGICLNLGFDHMYRFVHPLTEKLRIKDTSGTPELLAQLTEQYQLTINTIKCYQNRSVSSK